MAREKRRRKSIIDELFEEFPEGEITSGYSISVTQTPEGTRVKAKVGKDVNVNALKKRLQRQYPRAKIEIEGGGQEPLIREISTKPVSEEKRKAE